MRIIKIFIFNMAFVFSVCNANSSHSKLEKIEEQMRNFDLYAWPSTRPEKCSISSVAFSDIAAQVSSIAASMAHGKCYEKHSKLIGELSQMSRFLPSEEVDNLPKIENGALIDRNEHMTINISNTQIQSVQTNNSLVSGLLTLSKDKDCLEELRTSNKLSSVGSTIVKIGAVGMLIPSPIGLAGSAGLMTMGGAMKVLNQVLTPKYDWSKPEQRKEFMALTCAFYNLRSQLIALDFFRRPQESDEQRILLAEKLLRELAILEEESKNKYKDWKTDWNKLVILSLSEVLDNDNSQLYQEISNLLFVLRGRHARGLSVEDRLSIDTYIRTHQQTIIDLFNKLKFESPVVKSIVKNIKLWKNKSALDILALSEKTWQLGYIETLDFYFQKFINESYPKISQQLETFHNSFDYSKEMTNIEFYKKSLGDFQLLNHKLMTLRHDLKLKLKNLERIRTMKSLDKHSDGAQNWYEIMKDYQMIRQVMLGKKGWSFVKYLAKDAQKSARLFDRNYHKWIRKSKKKKIKIKTGKYRTQRTYQ